MKPETTAQRHVREAKLKELCEGLGLTVKGSTVIVKVGRHPIEIDASATDHNNLVPNLMYLAHQKGISEASL